VLLALLALALVAVALAAPLLFRAAEGWSARRARGRRARRVERRELRDPGRERRAEQRARELLRSCVNDEEWAMYRDLGFIRVNGRLSRKRRGGARGDADDSSAADDSTTAVGAPADGEPAAGGELPPYGYLIYPHKPIVAYVPKTGRLLSEYCVEFPDLTGAISQTRLPDSDDVLAKWMALTGDEERLIRNANMHLPGRQVDPNRVRRDLWRLSEWERQRRGYGSVRAPRT
jgi:hypothetical protein